MSGELQGGRKKMDVERIKALLIEDNPDDAELVRRALAQAKGVEIDVAHRERLSSAFELLDREQVDVIITDLGLPDSWGAETFERIQVRYPELPVVVLTGLEDEEMAMRIVKEGAQDYVVKGRTSPDSLVREIRYSIERKRLLVALEKSLREIKTLRGLLPLCAWCRKIRDDKGYWTSLEKYIREHTNAEFTHGICPSCLKKAYPEVYGILKEEPEVLDKTPEGEKDA